MAGEDTVCVLLGKRTGDNNQLLRLAKELGLPFRVIELRYNPLHLIPPRLLGPTLTSLADQSRREIRPPWSKLVLGIGYRSVPVALAIRKLSGGRTKLVRLGNPRLDPTNFDLVITTPQYGIPSAPNVIRLPVGIPAAMKIQPSEEECEWLRNRSRPHRLLVIGGDTFMWTLNPKAVAQAATEIASKGGSLLAVSSPRTSERVAKAVEAAIGGPVQSDFPRYPVLLADADEIYVTGDSVAMVSDAIATGKPVGIVAPTMTPLGRALYALSKMTKRAVPVRNISRFIDSVIEQELVGTVEKPIAGHLAIDPLATVVAAVRELL